MGNKIPFVKKRRVYKDQSLERKTRFELATPGLGSQCSTTEPLPRHTDYTSNPVCLQAFQT